MKAKVPCSGGNKFPGFPVKGMEINAAKDKFSYLMIAQEAFHVGFI